jgi:hypothetical protein
MVGRRLAGEFGPEPSRRDAGAPRIQIPRAAFTPLHRSICKFRPEIDRFANLVMGQ